MLLLILTECIWWEWNGADCANQKNWTTWIQDGKEEIGDDVNERSEVATKIISEFIDNLIW